MTPTSQEHHMTTFDLAAHLLALLPEEADRG